MPPYELAALMLENLSFHVLLSYLPACGGEISLVI